MATVGNGQLMAVPTNGHSPGPNGHWFEIRPRHSRLILVRRRLFLVGIFGSILFLCRWLAYQLRFDFNVPAEYLLQLDSL